MMSRDAVVCPNDLKFETRVATIILSSCGKFESQRTSIHETFNCLLQTVDVMHGFTAIIIYWD